MSDFLCVDPGLSGTGWCIINDGKLMLHGNIHSRRRRMQDKAADICKFLSSLRGYEHVFMEWPTGRFSNAKGIAAQNTDAILKLCYLIGRIDAEIGVTEFVPVVKHIGQLPKEVNHKRVRKYFNNWDIKNHAADAGSIAKYILNRNLR